MADARPVEHARRVAHAIAHPDRYAANPRSVSDAVRPTDPSGHA